MGKNKRGKGKPQGPKIASPAADKAPSSKEIPRDDNEANIAGENAVKSQSAQLLREQQQHRETLLIALAALTPQPNDLDLDTITTEHLQFMLKKAEEVKRLEGLASALREWSFMVNLAVDDVKSSTKEEDLGWDSQLTLEIDCYLEALRSEIRGEPPMF